MIPQTTQHEFPDFGVIVNELMKGCKAEDSDMVRISFMMKRKDVLKEFRTIRFNTGRQVGKTKWIMDTLAANPEETIVFTKDHGLAKAMVDKWTDNAPDTTSFRTAKEVAKRVLCGAMIKNYDPNSAYFKQYPVLEKAPRVIIIDEATYHIHFFINALYEWIAETADKNPIIILVG